MAAQAHSMSPMQVACHSNVARLHSSGVTRDGQISFMDDTRLPNRTAMVTIQTMAPVNSPMLRNLQTDFHQGSWIVGRPAALRCAFRRSMKYVISGDPYPTSRPPWMRRAVVRLCIDLAAFPNGVPLIQGFFWLPEGIHTEFALTTPRSTEQRISVQGRCEIDLRTVAGFKKVEE